MNSMYQEDELDRIAQIAGEEKFLQFTRGAFPCLFLFHVQEGFARVEVSDQAALDRLMAYCEEKRLQVEWVQAVINDEFHTREYGEFPGGKYVAHRLSDSAGAGDEQSQEPD